MQAPVTAVPLSLDDLDQTIAAFDTVEQLLRSFNPDTWRQELDSIYTQTHLHYISRAYHLASRHNKGKAVHLNSDRIERRLPLTSSTQVCSLGCI